MTAGEEAKSKAPEEPEKIFFMNSHGETFALYLHIPYCRRRCSYCDFNAHVLPESETDPFLAYREALVDDIKQQAGGTVTSIFWGGGTPSLMPIPHLAEVVSALHETFQIPSSTENTIEVNPGTASLEKFLAYQELGINRISIGAQSFQAEHLELVGRIHTSPEIVGCVEAARQAGFTNISLDLIYGFPGQTQEQWSETLRSALKLSPQHLSVYQLTVEPSTRLEMQLVKGELELPPEDEVVAMDDLAVEVLTQAGYHRYEISNWALPGRECAHNICYWADQQYLGLGCGAVSFLNGWRIERVKAPSYYQRALKSGRSPVVFAERRGHDGALKDHLMMGLRVAGEVDCRELARRYPGLTVDIMEAFFQRLPSHWWKRKDSRFELTRAGWDFHSEVTMALMDVCFFSPATL